MDTFACSFTMHWMRLLWLLIWMCGCPLFCLVSWRPHAACVCSVRVFSIACHCMLCSQPRNKSLNRFVCSPPARASVLPQLVLPELAGACLIVAFLHLGAHYPACSCIANCCPVYSKLVTLLPVGAE
jgi:hypothetical protein